MAMSTQHHCPSFQLSITSLVHCNLITVPSRSNAVTFFTSTLQLSTRHISPPQCSQLIFHFFTTVYRLVGNLSKQKCVHITGPIALQNFWPSFRPLSVPGELLPMLILICEGQVWFVFVTEFSTLLSADMPVFTLSHFSSSHSSLHFSIFSPW